MKTPAKTEELREELKKRFEARYKNSSIYDQLYVDWFPDDVMDFIQMEINSHREAELKGLIKWAEKRANDSYAPYRELVDKIKELL